MVPETVKLVKVPTEVMLVAAGSRAWSSVPVVMLVALMEVTDAPDPTKAAAVELPETLAAAPVRVGA